MYYLDSHLSNTSTNEKKNYLTLPPRCGVSGIFFPKRRAPATGYQIILLVIADASEVFVSLPLYRN